MNSVVGYIYKSEISENGTLELHYPSLIEVSIENFVEKTNFEKNILKMKPQVQKVVLALCAFLYGLFQLIEALINIVILPIECLITVISFPCNKKVSIKESLSVTAMRVILQLANIYIGPKEMLET